MSQSQREIIATGSGPGVNLRSNGYLADTAVLPMIFIDHKVLHGRVLRIVIGHERVSGFGFSLMYDIILSRGIAGIMASQYWMIAYQHPGLGVLRGGTPRSLAPRPESACYLRDEGAVEFGIGSKSATSRRARSNSGGKVLPRFLDRRRMPRQAMALK